MDESSDDRGKAVWKPMWNVLRPAMPAVIGAAALTFLFAALMPFSWVAAISWNLYLDRLSDFFVPPIGNAGRLALALGMAVVASLLAGFVALLIAKPEAVGLSSLRRRFARASNGAEDANGDPVLTRRRVDLHPDDPPRPPIRAGRDLPPGGLVALAGAVGAQSGDSQEAEELVLADLAPVAIDDDDDAPWLQPAELPSSTLPDPADHSLSAMVARLEAGLVSRRQQGIAPTTMKASDPMEEPEVDFALEAALSTLQRMTRQSAG